MLRYTSLLITLILLSCLTPKQDEGLQMEGAWLLEEQTELRIYGQDGKVYTCAFALGPNGMTVEPGTPMDYSLIAKGDGEYLYFENDEPRPLTIVNDTTIAIQRHGELSTWTHTTLLTPRRVEEISHILEADSGSGTRYVFSVAEEELKEENNTLELMVAGAMAALIIVGMVTRNAHKRRKRVERQLQQLISERENRPQILETALKNIEDDFYASPFYMSLCKRIAAGRLGKEDWEQIELQLGCVYPSFVSKLYGLYKMSEVELRVCMLLKLRVAPSDIATVLCREASSISTIRSRLYHKVFRRKGGAKDWDEFILTL